MPDLERLKEAIRDVIHNERMALAELAQVTTDDCADPMIEKLEAEYVRLWGKCDG